MSRTKSKHNGETCGDCGAVDATWASLNKAILLCTQCCSVHRSLGKHISHVKSLEKNHWNKYQLEMIHTLSNNGANNIWEHALLENKSSLIKKKPTADSPLNVKQEYIKLKHLNCSFALRENTVDGALCVENELGKELHASVRSPNLETSFRLLTRGANPNYFHDEKGTTPLHVAVKTEQKLQVELLLIYGADPTFPDAQGRNPVDYAKELANKELYSRLIENQYEVTDTFSYYLSKQKPDHNTTSHYFIPTTGFKSNPTSLEKLQKLHNIVFEELVMDVYDEVERRESEAIWLSCADTTDLLNTLPFLPVDNTLSTTRNQGRQKLARFTTPELKSLVFDILLDIQRRQTGTKSIAASDDDPLYDTVASDDDYAMPPDDDIEITSTTTEKSVKEQFTDSIPSAVVETLQLQLKKSEETITNLRQEITSMKQSLNDVKNENIELRSQLLQAKMSMHEKTNGTTTTVNNKENICNAIQEDNDDGEVNIRNGKKNLRPSSMYETREGITRLSNSNWHALKNEMRHNSEHVRSSATQSLYSSIDRENILQGINQLTKTLQNLTKCLGDRKNLCSCTEQIKMAIIRLASTIPKGMEVKTIQTMFKLCTELKTECSSLVDLSPMKDDKLDEQQINKIREIAFHLAYNSKEIVYQYINNHH